MGKTLVSVGAKGEQALSIHAAHNDTCKIAIDGPIYSYIYQIALDALDRRAAASNSNGARKQVTYMFVLPFLTPSIFRYDSCGSSRRSGKGRQP